MITADELRKCMDGSYSAMDDQEKFFELQKEKMWYLVRRAAIHGYDRIYGEFEYPLTGENRARLIGLFEDYGYTAWIVLDGYQINWKNTDL